MGNSAKVKRCAAVRQRRHGTIGHPATMKRVLQAPNLALATLWSDQLCAAGVAASVQRAFNSSIAGEVPPDQCLPEVWVTDDGQLELARTLLDECRHLPHHLWACPDCHEIVEGPFEQCWNCGADMPAPK